MFLDEILHFLCCRNTAKTFYAASIFFEIINQFGVLQPDVSFWLCFAMPLEVSLILFIKIRQLHLEWFVMYIFLWGQLDFGGGLYFYYLFTAWAETKVCSLESSRYKESFERRKEASSRAPCWRWWSFSSIKWDEWFICMVLNLTLVYFWACCIIWSLSMSILAGSWAKWSCSYQSWTTIWSTTPVLWWSQQAALYRHFTSSVSW